MKVVKKGGDYLSLDALWIYDSYSSLIDDAATSIAYTGTWSAQIVTGSPHHHQGTQHVATANGDSFSYPFYGTGIDFVSMKAGDRGGVDVFIDNQLVKTASCLSTTNFYQQDCASVTGLTRGAHVLKIVKKSGTTLSLDALRVADVPPVMIDNHDTSIHYDGTWTTGPASGQYGGTQSFTSTLNDSFTHTFTGRKIEYLTTMASNRGLVDVYLDNVKVQSPSCYSVTLQDKAVCATVIAQAAGLHTLKVVMKSGSGTYLSLDELRVTS